MNEFIKSKKIIMVLLIGIAINFLFGCSGWETVTFREYKKVEQLRGQPPKIYVAGSDSYVYIFSHSNYYIQNDTLFGKSNSGKEFVLTNIKWIQYNYDIEQEVDVYYDPKEDSVIGNKYAGARAYIEMNDGTDYTGELLIVRDSLMIICEVYEADEEELADSVYAIYVLNNYDIKLIELKAGNYVITGATIGFCTPYVAAIVVNDERDALNFAAIAVSFGPIIGGTIGVFIPNYNVVYKYSRPEEYDFKKLNVYARYVNNEPEFLKRIE